MLDLVDLEKEAEVLAGQLRDARCCDALRPCYRCSLKRYNVLARRRVVELPLPTRRVDAAVVGAFAMTARVQELGMLRAAS